MAQTDLYITWLHDAYAMEINLTQVLEHRVDDAKNYPSIQMKIQQHLDQTRQHAEMVKSVLERLGESTSAVKSGMAHIMGNVQAISTGPTKDEMVKNCLADYASESFEIACYRSLITAAQGLGDTMSAQSFQRILQDEQDAASFLMSVIPDVTQDALMGNTPQTQAA